MISIAHKILIKPNNKQRTYIQKAIRVANLAYNWGMQERNREYEATGAWNISGYELSRRFNKIKAEQFPIVLEVSNDVYCREFQEVHNTWQKFYDRRRKEEKHLPFPKPHELNEKNASIYIGCGARILLHYSRDYHNSSKWTKGKEFNISGKYQYLNIPRCGLVKMMQRLRFEGKIVSIYITKENNRYYASFNMEITEEEYKRTHTCAQTTPTRSVGIDLGIKTALTTSDRTKIELPTPIADCKKKTDRLKTKLNKLNRGHVKGFHSRNYDRLCQRVSKQLHHANNVHTDYVNKVASVLCRNYQHICMETLSIHRLNEEAKYAPLLKKGFVEYKLYKVKEIIEKKATHANRTFLSAPRTFASSKTCSCCGYKYRTLPLTVRWFECVCCHADGDRDLNAAINLRNYMIQQIGVGYTESTPADSVQLATDLERASVKATEVETGMRYPNPDKSFEVKGRLLEKKYDDTKVERKQQRKEKSKLMTPARVKREERRYLKEIEAYEKRKERERKREELKQERERIRAEKKAQRAMKPSSNVSMLYKIMPSVCNVMVESSGQVMPISDFWNTIRVYTSNVVCVKWRAYNQTDMEDETPIEIELADGAKDRYYKYVFENFEKAIHDYSNIIRGIIDEIIIDGYIHVTNNSSHGFMIAKFLTTKMGWPPHWTLTYGKHKLAPEVEAKLVSELNKLADMYESLKIIYD